MNALPSSRENRKYLSETTRRNAVREHFQELSDLVLNGLKVKLTKDGILIKALEEVTRLNVKVPSAVYSIGCLFGYRTIENITSDFINTLETVLSSTGKSMEKLHEIFKAHLHKDYMVYSEISGETQARKPFYELGQLIRNEKLAPVWGKLGMSQILEITVDFIKHRRLIEDQPKSVQESILFLKGVGEGQDFGKHLANTYFMKTPRLADHCETLNCYFNICLNSQQLQGVPSLPALPISLLSTLAANLAFPTPSPTVSPGPSISPSTASTRSTPLDEQNKSPVKEAKKFFRPWE